MYTIIQSLRRADRRALVELIGDAYVAPSGNIIGAYRIVFPALTRDAAMRALARLFQSGAPCSLWWAGAAQDVAAHIAVH